jgi:hypothetical protein
MLALISGCCPSLSKLWSADDSGAIWRTGLAVGRTDMRGGMNGLALQVQEASAAIHTPVISTCSEASEAI